MLVSDHIDNHVSHMMASSFEFKFPTGGIVNWKYAHSQSNILMAWMIFFNIELAVLFEFSKFISNDKSEREVSKPEMLPSSMIIKL